MAAWAAAIAGLLSAGAGIYGAASGGGGGARRDVYGDSYAQARQDAIDAALRATETSRLGRAGFSDSAGSSLQYDPVSNTWVSKLGELPQQAQTAADAASISRNTTDMYQARDVNAQSALNAARAQPLIDMARRRFENFRPQTAEDLVSLLSNRAVDANTQTYRPMTQGILTNAARTNSDPGQSLSDVGRSQSADLRRALDEAAISGRTSVAGINAQDRQGLTSDLQTATAAGTPNFQYPGIVPSTNNKDMLAAIQNRATGAAYTNALSSSSLNAANKARSDAAGAYAGSFPTTDPFASGLYSGAGQLANLFKDKNVGTVLDRLFGEDPKQKAKQNAINDLWSNDDDDSFGR